MAWDDLAPVKTCNSAGETINPKYLATSVPRVPALAMTNDYEFNPESLNSPPNPHAGSINGGGLNGDTGYQQLAADNIDSMLVSLRNGTHLTYTYIPYVLPANELGERIASYYTVAWFDHYLKGDPTGLNRLTSTTFDDSADTDSIGAGLYDPTLAAQNPLDPTAGNVSYKIAGLKVSNIVSFYYMSEYRLHNGTTLLSCADMRQANCAVPASGTP